MEPGPGIPSRNIHNIKLGRELIGDGAYSRNCEVRKSLCSFRTWKILLSSGDMDERLSSDHMNELCNYELKSSGICFELLSCQNQ